MADERAICGVGRHSRCFSEGLNHGEVDCPAPTHTIYLSGCDLRCSFCWAHRDVAYPGLGDYDLPRKLARAITERSSSANSIAFIGGSPTVNLLPILEALRIAQPLLPIVWNCDLYATPETIAILREFVDRFVIDLKFGRDDCAMKIARAPGYLSILHRNLRLLADRPLVVRHLVMPGHVECCTLPVVKWVKSNLPAAKLFLMETYRPFGDACRDQTLGRRPSAAEIDAARTEAAA